MKNNFLIMMVFIIASCGVVLEQERINGKWNLSEVEFYVYNDTIDAKKTYVSRRGWKPDYNRPLISEFFRDNYVGSRSQYTYQIEFDNVANKFTIYKNYGDPILNSTSLNKYDEAQDVLIVPEKNSSWSVDSFSNTLTFKVSNHDVTGDGTTDAFNYNFDFWEKGFKVHNSWPMSDYGTLELTIKASDVGKSYFSVDLSEDTIKVHSMKGIFKKY